MYFSIKIDDKPFYFVFHKLDFPPSWMFCKQFTIHYVSITTPFKSSFTIDRIYY